MNARDKLYTGATAVFDAANQPDYPTDESTKIIGDVLRILDDCTDEQFAEALLGCIMILGDRLADKRRILLEMAESAKKHQAEFGVNICTRSPKLFA